jgi:hypothetical protein
VSQSIVDADVWTVTVEVAADGDPVNGASQVLIGQDIADRTRFLHNRTLGPVGSPPYWHTPIGASPQVNNFSFGPPSGGGTFAWFQTATGGGVDLVGFPLATPLTGRITSVEAVVDGDLAAGAPHGALPAELPTFTLYRQDEAGATSGVVAGATDSSGSAAAYDVLHEIKIVGLSEDIGPNITWWVVLTGEGGAGSQANSFGLVDIRTVVEPAP